MVVLTTRVADDEATCDDVVAAEVATMALSAARLAVTVVAMWMVDDFAAHGVMAIVTATPGRQPDGRRCGHQGMEG